MFFLNVYGYKGITPVNCFLILISTVFHQQWKHKVFWHLAIAFSVTIVSIIHHLLWHQRCRSWLKVMHEMALNLFVKITVQQKIVFNNYCKIQYKQWHCNWDLVFNIDTWISHVLWELVSVTSSAWSISSAWSRSESARGMTSLGLTDCFIRSPTCLFWPDGVEVWNCEHLHYIIIEHVDYSIIVCHAFEFI